MRRLIPVLFSSLVALAGCGSDNPASEPAATATASLTVGAAGSGELDGRLALRVEFSAPLDAMQSLDGFLDLASAEGLSLPDQWVLGADGRTVFYPGVDAETRYLLEISPGLQSADGATLAARFQQTVIIGSIEPSARFASRGSVLLRDLTAGLPVRSTNVAQVDLEFFRVRPDRYGEFFSRFAQGGLRYSWSLGDISEIAESVYAQRFDTLAAPNQASISRIPVQSVEVLRAAGLYLALMRPAGRLNDYYDSQLFSVSDLAIHARRFDRNTAVFVSQLSDGSPVGQANVYLVDQQGERRALSTSDDAGFARLEGPTTGSDLLVVERTGDAAYLYFGEPALDLSRYPVDGEKWRPTQVYAYSPRDLFRPGNELLASVLVRDHDGAMTGLSQLHYRLVRPDGRDAARGALPLNDLGFGDFAWTSSAASPTGTWTLELRIDPESDEAAKIHQLRVQEFLPERLAVELRGDSGAVVGNQSFDVEVEGSYLYGAPASGNTVTLELSLVPVRKISERWAGFEFGPLTDEAPETVELTDQRLDNDGLLTVAVEPSAHPFPFIARLYAAVLESGGRGVERSFARPVWPQGQMPGIRPLFDEGVVSVRDSASFEVIVAGADQELIAGSTLDVTLIREDREYFWTFDEYEGWSSEYSERRVTVLEQELVSAGQPQPLAFDLRPGWYEVQLADRQTGLVTALSFTVGNMWQASGQTAVVPDRAGLELDRPVYRIGDTVEATLISPHDGYAIVTLEANEVLWQRRMAVTAGETRIELPLADENWRRHDLYLTAVVARPATADRRSTPQRAIGMAPVLLDRTDRKLEVAISAPDSVRPLEPLVVEVHVPDAAGQRAAVTVAAVDQGILNITRFETPDPMADIFAHRRYAGAMQDLYHRVIEQPEGAAATRSYGGDMDPGRRAGSEAEVKLLALYSGQVALDGEGRAQVEFAVPDFTGSVKLMAVAFTESRFGASDASVLARAPVTASLSLPRFAAPGDQPVAMLELHNLSDENRPVALDWSSSGIDADLPGGPDELAAGQKVRLPFPFAVEQSFGVGELSLTVASGDYAYTQSRELAIRPPYPDERRIHWEEVPAGVSRTFDPAWTKGLMADSTVLRVRASTRPPLGLVDAADGLLHYPYGCLEQTVSSAYPWLLLTRERQQALGIDVEFPSGRSAEQAVARALGKLLGMQRADGYFVMWESARNPARIMSAYVAEYLLDASDQGFALPTGMLDQLNAALLSGLSTGAWNFDSPASHVSYLAHAALVLARQGAIELPAIRAIRERTVKQAESGLDLVRLAVALKLAGAEREGQELFAKGMLKPRSERYYHDYGSTIRDRALKLAYALEHGMMIPDLAEQLRRLSADVANERWLSTQERIGLLRLGVALGPTDEDLPLELSGAGEADRTARGSLAAVIKGAAASERMQLANGGQSPAYLMVDAVGFPIQAPPAGGGAFAIHSRLYHGNGQPLTDGRFRQGEVVYQHIAVTSRVTTQNALLVALLPAGLELENPATGGRATEAFREQHLDVDDWYWNDESLIHAEYRDDRFAAAMDLDEGETYHAVFALRAVTVGDFVQPPIFVEDMYRPDQRGIGAVAHERITVNPRL